MENRKYSAIVFDLGNVLIPFDYSIMMNRLDLIEKGLGKKFMTHYKNNYDIHRKFERGDLKSEEFIELMLKSCNGNLDKETFCRYFSEIFRLNSDVAALLPELKKKYKVVLLSNTNSIHREYGYKNYEFLKHFDKLILSHEVGAVKPEPAIYKAVEDFTKLPPEEHIFIDDVLEYVEGAKKMGWDAVQFTGYGKLVEDLKARGII
ncbi:MAG: HAD family phosphatase [Ignavibacteria bacterium]|jgi:putative hydrolase of the HAD superfamily|nr:HAD family phosphatase [Ignavibacteria bacterium]MCU7504801.1 HAD family phosphatase [Ignavibacteria bacterium]MCU7517687.1 HAD family phosphatase [Ignavibacteria bacterium]